MSVYVYITEAPYVTRRTSSFETGGIDGGRKRVFLCPPRIELTWIRRCVFGMPRRLSRVVKLRQVWRGRTWQTDREAWEECRRDVNDSYGRHVTALKRPASEMQGTSPKLSWCDPHVYRDQGNLACSLTENHECDGCYLAGAVRSTRTASNLAAMLISWPR